MKACIGFRYRNLDGTKRPEKLFLFSFWKFCYNYFRKLLLSIGGVKNGQSFVRFAYIFLFISGLVVHGGAGRVFLAGACCLRRADGVESAVHGLRFVGHDGLRILPSSF